MEVFQDTFLKALEYRVVKPFAGHPFALTIDRIDRLIDLSVCTLKD